MISMRRFAVVLTFLANAVLPLTARGQGIVPTDFSDVAVRGQLDYPTDFAFLPDGRLFVIEQYTARVRLVMGSGAFGTFDPALTVDSVRIGGERGLLSIAIDPRWPSSPYVYVYACHLDGFIHVTRYQAIGDLADGSSGNLRLDAASKYCLLRDIPDVSGFDNGGAMRFAADSTLFVSLGQDDSYCGAQDTTSLRGVILRLEVRGLPASGPPDKALLVATGNPFVAHANRNARLVWALGLRNPYRIQHDAPTGRLFVADVGEGLWEEIDIDDAPALNFGWPRMQGNVPHASCPGPVPAMTAPIYVYARPGSGTNVAVIGAGVYRATGCPACPFPPEYEGDYFFSDYYQGFLRRLKLSGGTWSIAPAVPGQPDASNWGTGFNEVSGWVEGPDGALWYCRQATSGASFSGQIRKIRYGGLLGVADPRVAAVRFGPPAPSPARGGTRLTFTLARDARTSLRLYDGGGRLVVVLAPERWTIAGTHEIAWDGRGADGVPAAAGIYFAVLRVDGASHMQRLPLVR